MIMIQDDPMPTGADKPLRITGDPHKVQVSLRSAQCVPLSVLFTLNFTHFMPSAFNSNVLFQNFFIFLRSRSVRLGFVSHAGLFTQYLNFLFSKPVNLL